MYVYPFNYSPTQCSSSSPYHVSYLLPKKTLTLQIHFPPNFVIWFHRSLNLIPGWGSTSIEYHALSSNQAPATPRLNLWTSFSIDSCVPHYLILVLCAFHAMFLFFALVYIILTYLHVLCLCLANSSPSLLQCHLLELRRRGRIGRFRKYEKGFEGNEGEAGWLLDWGRARW